MRDYAAFISYAHADEAVAARLHRAIETYRLPKDLRDNPDKIVKPVFRDVAELTAHHSLSEKIRDAVQRARFLIVLCSPTAKASHWVNEEIHLFRKLHGEGSILSVLVEGTPETSFPSALTEDGREPLAANLNMDKHGFRFGVAQIVAAMVGTGLDALIQRDTKRRNRRLQIGMAASLALTALMGFMTWSAVDARKTAEASRNDAVDARNDAEASRDAAEKSRNDAEGLIEYMVGDLKKQLEPVGRLEILDGVGNKVIEYYDDIAIYEMDDERLQKQSKARHILGQVALDQGKNVKAEREIKTAHKLTREILRRSPDDVEATFDHSQSEYYLGLYYYRTQDHKRALGFYKEYKKNAEKLLARDPESFDWNMEVGWGNNNIGKTLSVMDKPNEAIDSYLLALKFFSRASLIKNESYSAKIELSNAYAGLANEFYVLNNYDKSKKNRLEQISIISELAKSFPKNYDLKFRMILSKLKFQSLENSENNRCEIEKHKELLLSLRQLIEYDRTNYVWHFDYVRKWNDYLNQCADQISQVKLETYVNKLRNDGVYFQMKLEQIEEIMRLSEFIENRSK